ncbi:hypothetical protein ACFVFJ_47175 [Streptomyces sp. NPDC057717]|uniref:hypothetical protein n=1 Tax=Streptomyces sp. NPDC057717 TaxID=3346224 RepID=UPI0036B413BA
MGRVFLARHGGDSPGTVAAEVSGDLMQRPAVAGKFASGHKAPVVEVGPGR